MDTQSLAFRIIEQFVESNDNLLTLSDLADRLESMTDQLRDAWLGLSITSSERDEIAAHRVADVDRLAPHPGVESLGACERFDPTAIGKNRFAERQ